MITSMMSQKTKDDRAGKILRKSYWSSSRYLLFFGVFLVALVMATMVSQVSYSKSDPGGGANKPGYTEAQYCKELKALGKESIICKSQFEQDKAKASDPVSYNQAKQDYQRAKEVYEKGQQAGSNNNQNQGNKDGNKNQDGGKDQNNKSQEPEHKDDGDGSNKKKDSNKSGGNGSTGGGGASSSPHQCGNAGTFFDWGCNGASDKDSILTVLVTISNWLAAGVVIAVIGGIIYGAIMYATSAGDAAKAKSATEIIRNAFIALILYFLMWAFLQYIVPGGLFN